MKTLGLFLFLFSLQSFAGYDGDFTARVEQVESVPAEVYHWVARRKLNSWSAEIEKRNQAFTFPYLIKEESQFAYLWKAFSDRNGVFTWIDPVLGSQGVNHESYSTDAELMVLQLNSDAKAIRLISDGKTKDDYSKILQKSGVQLDSVQVIEHITPQIHEWIVVDPKAIKNFSADPKETYPKVWEALQPYLNDPFHRPKLSEIHFRYGKDHKDPVWVTEPKSAWSVSVMLLRLVRNLTINPESPYFAKDEVKKYENDNFELMFPKLMNRKLLVQCEKLFLDMPAPKFDLQSVKNRIQEFRKR